MRRLVWFAFPLVLALHQTLACGLPSEECGQNRPCTEGFRCIEGRCIALCKAWWDCKAGERCDNDLCSKTPCPPALCNEGQRRCTSDLAKQETCQRQRDGCLGWFASEACGPRETCKDGSCVSPPFEECKAERPCPEGFQCSAGRCAPLCKTWRDCGGGGRCENGLCSYTPCPSNPCNEGQRRCTSDLAKQETCQRQDDGCFEWIAGETCKEEERCREGACFVCRVCSEGEVRCSSDGETLQTCLLQTDGCTRWQATLSCGLRVCHEGKCVDSCRYNGQKVASCPSDRPICDGGECCKHTFCTVGETRCSPTNLFALQICQREKNGCYEWKDIFCEGGNRCAVCKEGETKCSWQHEPTTSEICQRDAAGCLFWKVNACEEGRICSACKVGEVQCGAGPPYSSELFVCQKDAGGCVVWKKESCVGGIACEPCTPGERRCSSVNPEGTEVCRRDAVGCTSWAVDLSCKGGKLCAGAGLCADHACPMESSRRCATWLDKATGISSSGVEECERDSQGRLFWKQKEVCDHVSTCDAVPLLWDGEVSCSWMSCASSHYRIPYCAGLVYWGFSSFGICGHSFQEQTMCMEPEESCIREAPGFCAKSTFFSCINKPLGVWTCENGMLYKCEKTAQGKGLKQIRSCREGCNAAPSGQDAVCRCQAGSRRCLQNQEETCTNGVWQKIRDCRTDEECRVFRASSTLLCSPFPIASTEAATVESVTYCQEMNPPLSRCHVKAAHLQATLP